MGIGSSSFYFDCITLIKIVSLDALIMYKCQSMVVCKFQKELMLIRQMQQSSDLSQQF